MAHIFKYGKHKGQSIETVDDSYLEWMVRSGQESIDLAMKELARRQSAMDASLSMVDRIIKEGYRALSQKLHPDKPGGSDALMKELNGSYESLKQARGIK